MFSSDADLVFMDPYPITHHTGKTNTGYSSGKLLTLCLSPYLFRTALKQVPKVTPMLRCFPVKKCFAKWGPLSEIIFNF